MISNFMEEFICGRRFQIIADYIWDSDKKDKTEKFTDRKIIWCKTDFIKPLFGEIANHKNNYVLITHNSDYPISENIFKSKPKCIKKWFAENVDFKHNDLIPLPLGLENDMGPSKGAYTKYDAIEKNINTNNKINDVVYCNFTKANNRSRTSVIEKLKENKIMYWDERKDYYIYCKNMSEYQFIASPIGNGIECHRTWESLYLGCMPIVEKHFLYDCFVGLPIFQIEDWSMINKEWLGKKREEIKTKKYDLEKLKMSYWTKKIKESL